jgi:hypothetical protein
MFTSTPVMSSDSTRFDRPYEMNGSVSPVVGSSPITTPMWRYAVSTIVGRDPDGEQPLERRRRVLAMRKPSHA